MFVRFYMFATMIKLDLCVVFSLENPCFVLVCREGKLVPLWTSK